MKIVKTKLSNPYFVSVENVFSLEGLLNLRHYHNCPVILDTNFFYGECVSDILDYYGRRVDIGTAMEISQCEYSLIVCDN